MLDRRINLSIALSLLLAVFLWGGSNAATKVIVGQWPPIWTGGSRFFCAGLLMLAILRWTRWLGVRTPLTPSLNRQVWVRGGLSLAIYIVIFNFALHLTTASHVALYLGASPVWALLWEGLPPRSWRTVQRYGAAALALSGVVVLFAPSLKAGGGHWLGECLGLAASVLWTSYGRQCRILGAHLSGAELTAHTMWRAGILLLPFGAIEVWRQGFGWSAGVAGLQLYCIVAGGVATFAIWNNALRRWPTSQVLLFNNLIPISTTTWAHLCLGESLTPTFWLAMGLVVTGVVLGQTDWQRLIGLRAVPPE